jgi:hypothetical protein
VGPASSIRSRHHALGRRGARLFKELYYLAFALVSC